MYSSWNAACHGALATSDLLVISVEAESEKAPISKSVCYYYSQ